jgi:hypothetical protein
MPSPHLARIAYASATHEEPSDRERIAQLSSWRRGNAGRGITGIVLYQGDSAFQVLEGFPDAIEALYATIAHDPQHWFVSRLIAEPIAERSFGDWSMGHARTVGISLAAPGPLRRVLDPDFRYWQCDEAAARRLVAAFTTGPWRRAIR